MSTGKLVTKSELIEIITAKQKHLPAKDVELALKQILEIMSDALSQGERIEIRGFGSFSLHFRPPRQGRNPKTGRRSRCQVSTSRISSRGRTCANGSMTERTGPSGTDTLPHLCGGAQPAGYAPRAISACQRIAL